MTRVCCSNCRLRFTSAAAAILTTCPDCGAELEAVASAEALLGYRLFEPFDSDPALPIAVEMEMEDPRHDRHDR
jgi:predicted  nucleic acid-binding Zn-ribbon protein